MLGTMHAWYGFPGLPPLPPAPAAAAAAAAAGLETLAQLISTPSGMIPGVTADHPLTVADGPQWSYRGLMIDTGRHFLGLDEIRHAIRGMGALKL